MSEDLDFIVGCYKRSADAEPIYFKASEYSEEQKRRHRLVMLLLGFRINRIVHSSEIGTPSYGRFLRMEFEACKAADFFYRIYELLCKMASIATASAGFFWYIRDFHREDEAEYRTNLTRAGIAMLSNLAYPLISALELTNNEETKALFNGYKSSQDYDVVNRPDSDIFTERLFVKRGDEINSITNLFFNLEDGGSIEFLTTLVHNHSRDARSFISKKVQADNLKRNDWMNFRR